MRRRALEADGRAGAAWNMWKAEHVEGGTRAELHTAPAVGGKDNKNNKNCWELEGLFCTVPGGEFLA